MGRAEKHDQWLQQRMQQVGLTTWGSLRQATGLSRHSLTWLRQGKGAKLKLSQWQKIAQALQWDLPSLLSIACPFHLPTPEADLPPQDRLSSIHTEASTHSLSSPSSGDPTPLEHTRQHHHQQQTFLRLKTLLTSYPTIIQMVETQPELPAKNLIPLLQNLDQLLTSWDYQPIGSVWQAVPFDPQRHQPDQPDIREGETVYIRFIGYQQGSTIICPAKVSRYLPSGGSRS